MPDELPDYEPLMREAVGAFWGARDRQAAAQRLRGTVDAGTRGAVTGGAHLSPIELLIRRVLVDAGVDEDNIYNGRRACLPGYYRESKSWDTVVIENETVMLVIELKSQVGSFGNNLNNRVEEAIGQATDFWEAVDKSVIPGLRPWFGYFMLVESSRDSMSPRRGGNPLIPADPAFHKSSYVARYALAFERLHADRLLDAVALAISPANSDQVTYPSKAFSFQHFATAIHNRVREVRAAL
jgi:hypothetical protein